MSRSNCRARTGGSCWFPIGFAHGFCTLEPDTEVLYKVTNYLFARRMISASPSTIPRSDIDWGVDLAQAKLSDKDRRHPRLADLPFVFD